MGVNKSAANLLQVIPMNFKTLLIIKGVLMLVMVILEMCESCEFKNS